MSERQPDVPRSYQYPSPVPPAPSQVPTAETAAYSRWQFDNAPHRTSVEFARRWVAGTELADPAVSGDFVDRRVVNQLIEVDSYPTKDGGWVSRDDYKKVTHNAWLLSVLHPERPDRGRIGAETVVVAERVGERWVNRILHEAREENALYDRETALRERERRLREMVDHDSLTGLYNRSGWTAQTLRRGAQGDPLVVIQLDIDHFKVVNDAYGHVRGDDVLRALGRILSQNSRETDIIARMADEQTPMYKGTKESVAGRTGGDEYVITLSPNNQEDPLQTDITLNNIPNQGEFDRSRRGHDEYGPFDQGASYIERIRQSFQAWLELPGNEDIQGIGLGLLAGISVWDGGEPLGSDDLIGCVMQADMGMYHDKRQRRQESMGLLTPERRSAIQYHLAQLELLGVHVDPRLVGLPSDIMNEEPRPSVDQKPRTPDEKQ